MLIVLLCCSLQVSLLNVLEALLYLGVPRWACPVILPVLDEVTLSLHKSNGNTANWLRKLNCWKFLFRMSLLGLVTASLGVGWMVRTLHDMQTHSIKQGLSQLWRLGFFEGILHLTAFLPGWRWRLESMGEKQALVKSTDRSSCKGSIIAAVKDLV